MVRPVFAFLCTSGFLCIFSKVFKLLFEYDLSVGRSFHVFPIVFLSFPLGRPSFRNPTDCAVRFSTRAAIVKVQSSYIAAILSSGGAWTVFLTSLHMFSTSYRTLYSYSW